MLSISLLCSKRGPVILGRESTYINTRRIDTDAPVQSRESSLGVVCFADCVSKEPPSIPPESRTTHSRRVSASLRRGCWSRSRSQPLPATPNTFSQVIRARQGPGFLEKVAILPKGARTSSPFAHYFVCKRRRAFFRSFLDSRRR